MLLQFAVPGSHKRFLEPRFGPQACSMSAPNLPVKEVMISCKSFGLGLWLQSLALEAAKYSVGDGGHVLSVDPGRLLFSGRGVRGSGLRCFGCWFGKLCKLVDLQQTCARAASASSSFSVAA